MPLVIIDDCPLTLAILKRLASARGARPVMAFKNPKTALQYLEGGEAKVIILDNSMDGMDGLEMARRLRGSQRHAATPIVMVTGSEDPIVRKLALLAGVNDFLQKPIDVAQFKAVLSRLLPDEDASVPVLTGAAAG